MKLIDLGWFVCKLSTDKIQFFSPEGEQITIHGKAALIKLRDTLIKVVPTDETTPSTDS